MTWFALKGLSTLFALNSKKRNPLAKSPTKNAPISLSHDQEDEVTPIKTSPPASPTISDTPQQQIQQSDESQKKKDRDEKNKNILYAKEAFRIDAKTGERIEADTDDAENSLNLNSILLPDDQFPSDAKSFAVSYNKSLFDGWVKQPSPCCAAASVAGAYNGLLDLKREDDGSKGHLDVLPLMADMLKEQLTTKKASFERLLGANIDVLIEAVKEELAKRGRTLGGKEKMEPA